MFYVAWLLLGLVAVLPLLKFAQGLSLNSTRKLLGRSLIIAALVYIGFALLWGTSEWLLIEVLGVAIYGLFYWAAIRYSIYWLAAGWFFHPLWDILLHLQGPGQDVAPPWYAVACASFDWAVAFYIVYRATDREINR